MKKIILGLIYLFSHHQLSANEKILVGMDILPIEFQYALEGFQELNLSPREKEWLQIKIQKIDQLLTVIPKEYALYLIKSEIYKLVLEEKAQEVAPLNLVNENNLRAITTRLSQGTEAYGKFSQWLLYSVKFDLEELIKQKNQLAGSFEGKGVSLKKKMALLAPWLSQGIDFTAEEFNTALKPLFLKIFENTDNYLTLLYSHSSLSQKALPKSLTETSYQFQFFTEKAVTKAQNPGTPAPQKPATTVEAAKVNQKLETIDAQKTMDKLGPAPTGTLKAPPAWTPRPASNDSTPAETPEKLPIPVDDWRPKR